MKKNENNEKIGVIYLSIDHLKEGKYILRIIQKTQIIKEIKILKK